MNPEKARPEAVSDKRSSEMPPKELTLFNDEVNLIGDVIKALIEVCDHQPEQAEQCAMITHLKGSCVVKKGTAGELRPLCQGLKDRGLTAEVL